MGKIPKHYQLKAEHPDSFEIHDTRDKSSFHIAKKALDLGMHKKLASIPHYDDGTPDGAVGEGDPQSTASKFNPWPTDWDPTPANAPRETPWSSDPVAPIAPGFMANPSMVGGPDTVPTPASAPFDVSGLKLSPDQQNQLADVAPQNTQPTSTPAKGGSTKASTSPEDDAMARYLAAQNQEVGGIQAEANAKSKMGDETAKQIEASNFALRGAMDSAKQDADFMTGKMNSIATDIASSKIDPQQFVHNMGTGNKIMSAIAIGLGGIGAGLSGQPNVAMGLLQKNIADDIDAQKADLGKKQSLYSHYLQQFGDQNAAASATMMHMNTIAQGQIAKIAAQNSGAINQGAAQAMIGGLKQTQQLKAQELQQQLQVIKMRQAAMSGQFGPATDPSTLVPYLVDAKDQPKVYEEIKDLQNIKNIAQPSMDAFDKAAKEVRPMSGGIGTSPTALIPGMESPSQKAWQGLANTTVKDVEGTAKQAAFDSLTHNFRPAFGDSDANIAEKRKGWQQYLTSHASAPVAKGNHLDLTKYSSTNFNPGLPEGQIIVNKQTGQRMIMKNGSYQPLGN